ncbi:tyrosine-protein phosphatase [Microtetraspora sp. NBRC 13810]|uniref:tyrosine-protein phosphatase n=1 Tax=Microtetraspora sp. NBRC 13810 TaxID=3030990 RepID=UPI0025569CDC|nr:tyrosine-protein phosphatase [Microtetraspora sp. NBRC 13810]
MTRHIRFSRVHNFRDLGGYAADAGLTVRWGRLYRSDSLAKLQGADWDRFLALGVRTVIDLRYPWEIAARGRIPESDGLGYHNLSIEHRPYDQEALGADVEPGRYLADRFGEVAHDGTAEIRRALEVVAEGDAPAVFHCASGKDRTGLLAALILSLLGVSEEDVVADFALTELATAGLVADWSARNEGRAPRWPGYGRAPGEVMRLFLADLTASYGSVRGYTADRLGVDDELVTLLRKQLLEDRDGTL